MKDFLKKQSIYWAVIAIFFVGWLWTVTIHDIYTKNTAGNARRLDALAIELESRANGLNEAWKTYIETRERWKNGSEAMNKISVLEHRIDVMGDILTEWRLNGQN